MYSSTFWKQDEYMQAQNKLVGGMSVTKLFFV